MVAVPADKGRWTCFVGSWTRSGIQSFPPYNFERIAMRPDDDSEFDWDEWMALPEGETERILNSELRQYDERLSRMTDAQRIAHSRGIVVRTCAGWRRTLKMMDMPFIRENLRKSQRRLVQLREWRRTGIEPGTAELH